MIGRILSRFSSVFKQNFPAGLVQIKNEGLTYLSLPALEAIRKTVKEIEAAKTAGVFIETGCALGGSAILIAQNKKKERLLYLYDVFGMIPAPGEHDGQDVQQRYETIRSGKSTGLNNNKYYGYEEDLLEKVKNNFRKQGLEPEEHNVVFVKGLYEETLRVTQAIAFAHIDCDWYDSVMVCLKAIVPQLAQEGVIIIDDYYDWSGCKTATDEYFLGKENAFELSTVANKLQVRRKKIAA